MAASTGTSSRTTFKFGKCPSCQQDVEDVVHVEVTVGRVEIVQDSSNRNRATALIVGGKTKNRPFTPLPESGILMTTGMPFSVKMSFSLR